MRRQIMGSGRIFTSHAPGSCPPILYGSSELCGYLVKQEQTGGTIDRGLAKQKVEKEEERVSRRATCNEQGAPWSGPLPAWVPHESVQ